MPYQRNRFYDITSDTATEPTDDMFDIMKTASRGDDVFGEDTSVNALEAHVAKLLGQESALFCVSGCMTNQLGLRTLLQQPPHSVLLDARSHIFNYECGGLAYHSQASASPVVPRNGHHLTVEDIKSNLIMDTTCSPVTKVVALENTLNGCIIPLDEIKRIREFTISRDIKMHLDGARLWNASEETGVPLHEYSQYFDTVSVCLSKGVGAPIGSMLAGSRQNIIKARHIRKLMGGGWRQAGSLAITAQHCIDKVVPTMKQTHELTKRLATGLQELNMELSYPCETNMIFLNTAPVGITVDALAAALKQHGIIMSKDTDYETRIVFHYQIPEHVVVTFLRVASELVAKKKLDPTPIQYLFFQFAEMSFSTKVKMPINYNCRAR
ncbi:pyridoxal phosphate-dependent transferase [Parasitella parasitica]|nr:pyridoxal phosphate-dependent transferase [Parasitella parasitica]